MTAACPACGADSPLRFVTTDRNRRISDAEFRYYLCPSCALLFLAPIPPDLGRYYPRSYYEMPSTIEELERMARADEYKVAIIRRFAPGGRLLEIGPAYGAFALLAKRAGYEVTCVELDTTCAGFLNDVVGVRAIQSAEPAAALDGMTEQFDVICSWQNLEHLPNGRAAFEAAARRLVPGGVLIISTPNPDALQFRIFGPKWTHVDAPRHVALVPMSLIRRWSAASGLTPRMLTTVDPGSRGWNRFGWEQTLANFATPRALRLLLRLIGLGLTVLAIPMEWTGTRGSCYTAVLERERS
jgi:2-polyprenyl-3-methyl-5-hydroxy-6-metoxy-1,4-benzoquinol methylase